MKPLILQGGNLLHPHGNGPRGHDENSSETGITTSKNILHHFKNNCSRFPSGEHAVTSSSGRAEVDFSLRVVSFGGGGFCA